MRALLSHFAQQLKAHAAEVVVLTGRCHERETVPFKVLDGGLDELSRWLRHLPQAEAATLVPRFASLVCQVFPVLGRVPVLREAPLPTRDIVDPQERRERLFQAVRELFTRLAERRPLVLCIDDFHWSDADGRQLLGAVMREPDPPPLLLLCAQRPGYGTDCEPEFLRAARRIALAPLSQEEGASTPP